MRTCSALIVVLLVSSGAFDAPRSVAGAPVWIGADPDYAWSFPRDHWAHTDHRLEWWYFTGHLASRSEPARRFGFQLTIFRIGLHPRPLGFESHWTAANLLMGHAAITDKDNRRHVFSELLYRESELLAGFSAYPDPEIAWSRAPVGTEGRWSLRWNGEAFDFEVRDDAKGIAFALSTEPLKPLVFEGPNGYSRKDDAPGAASLYYSFTRLATTGTLELDGEVWQVDGLSWMDKEFSTSSLGEDQVGWDWFSMQLDDGRELMLYSLRRSDRQVDYRQATLVDAGGRARHLRSAEWHVRVTGRWRSPETDADYPSQWQVELPADGILLTVRPDVAAQENVARLAGDLYYWEGAVSLFDERGTRLGNGYVELTGYGPGNRPPV